MIDDALDPLIICSPVRLFPQPQSLNDPLIVRVASVCYPPITRIDKAASPKQVGGHKDTLYVGVSPSSTAGLIICAWPQNLCGI